MKDLSLMQRIRARWGTTISEACHLSSVPEAFVAALVAGESAGDPTAQRFEPHVYRRLLAVRSGTLSHYGAITQKHLVSLGDEGLRCLATSYGPTQIMGYNAVFHHEDPLRLKDFPLAMTLTLRMLAEAAQQFGLDLRSDFEAMLRWWNTGAPYDDLATVRIEGKTYDPDYVPNALRRMEIYKSLNL